MTELAIGMRVRIHSRPSSIHGVRLRAESGTIIDMIGAGSSYEALLVVVTDSGTKRLVYERDVIVLEK